MSAALVVRGLQASLGDLAILKGVDLEVPYGEVHALMGPNGSGKSTLCHVLMGQPEYTASGSALVGGTEVLGLPVDARARAGLFLGFQYPVEVPGVTLRELLEEMGQAAGAGAGYWSTVEAAAERMALAPFLGRPVNEGLSGGEKKRSEMLQLLALRPRVAVLDEIDSGLDIDAVREVAAAVEAMRSPDLGVLLITHYSRILRYIAVDRVHVMAAGRVIRSGGKELAGALEAGGYDAMVREAEPAAPPAADDFLQGL
ncbi:MAG: Fe-S cluster assembly ATPase SufC [Acidimicrobiia bacterium]|nr:Fe-S cluster assembly ATPase SufC [Acidimicrobiia bacterium]